MTRVSALGIEVCFEYSPDFTLDFLYTLPELCNPRDRGIGLERRRNLLHRLYTDLSQKTCRTSEA